MKNFYFLIVFTTLILFSANSLFAQQRINTEDKIIESCLTFPPLLEKIPTMVKEQIMEYLILDHGVEFQFSPNLKIDGKSVSLISKDQLVQNKPYFDFFTLNIEVDKVVTTYYLTYNLDNEEHIIPVTIHFEKKDLDWKVINYTI
ncbi:MAG: hypothetical protein KKG99_16400 [Bacteroidetes bacterium]|nr:hypothetical protein [Bacteroidota bacterium]